MDGPIPDGEGGTPDGHGADLRFLGVVRAEEEDRRIAGIRYSAYPEMVEAVFSDLRAEAADTLPDHAAEIVHRVGFVAAGQPSLLLRVSSRHSAPAIEALGWYLEQVKTRLPIWKEPMEVAP